MFLHFNKQNFAFCSCLTLIEDPYVYNIVLTLYPAIFKVTNVTTADHLTLLKEPLKFSFLTCSKYSTVKGKYFIQ